MDPIEMLGPNKEVLGFFKSYMLTGVKNLNEDERKVYLVFLQHLSNPRIIVEDGKINMNDLVRSNKPGAIIRRKR